MALVYLSLGSNLGDRRENLANALFQIETGIGRILEESGVHEYESWGYKSSNSFLNMAIVIDTSFMPDRLLEGLKNIESLLGRQESTGDYTDRSIDIDIIFYDKQVIDTPQLKVPHPLMEKRRFVLEPLNEIAPDFLHPVLKKRVHDLLNSHL